MQGDICFPQHRFGELKLGHKKSIITHQRSVSTNVDSNTFESKVANKRFMKSETVLKKSFAAAVLLEAKFALLFFMKNFFEENAKLLS